MSQARKYPEPKNGVFSDELWNAVAPALFAKIAEGERASIEAAQAKQLEARRKMRELPDKPTITTLPHSDWHGHYKARVGSAKD